MSEIVAIEHMTLDGVIQAPARPDEDPRDNFPFGGWASAAGSDPALQGAIGTHMEKGWSLLAGRIGFEDLGGYWPKQPPNPMTDALNKAEKFVVASRPTISWQNTTILDGDPVAAVQKLKQSHDKPLLVFGSGMLVQSLMNVGLVDVLVLMIHPLVLGKGRRLFAEDGAMRAFRLADSTITKDGVFVGTYRQRAPG